MTVVLCEFTVPGRPVAKGRPRVTSRGTYTPRRTLDAEMAVALCARAAISVPVAPRMELVEVTCVFWLPDRRRVDVDNLAKLVTDALNGVVYEDDSQIVQLNARKVLGAKEAKTWVRVTTAQLQEAAA